MKSRLSLLGLAVLTIVLVVSIARCGGDGGDGGVAAPCGDSEAVYVRMDADDGNTGTILGPLRTIQAALECAEPGQDIRVANGTYNANTVDRIILTEGKSTYGGYSSDYQVRDPAVYPTIIDYGITTGVPDEVTPASESTPILIDGNTTPITVLDGFIINGPPTSVTWSVGAIITNGSPTISNNIINGGGSDSTNASRAITINNSGPVINNNTINGGNSVFSDGIWGNVDGAVITNNTIDDGINITLAANVSTIRNNSIIARGFVDPGIRAQADPITASIIIEANTIAGGTTGIWIESEGGSIIRNNIIVTEGSVMPLSGINSSSNSIISNNTIVVASSDDPATPTTGIGISSSTLPPVIQNNIIALTAGTCIAGSFDTSEPVSLKNNDLTGCATLYADDTVRITNIDDLNALSDTDASGNVSIPPNLDSTQDYHLTGASPVEVTQGGLDLSVDFSTDKAGNTRTVPWSMGAYEYD